MRFFGKEFGSVRHTESWSPETQQYKLTQEKRLKRPVDKVGVWTAASDIRIEESEKMRPSVTTSVSGIVEDADKARFADIRKNVPKIEARGRQLGVWAERERATAIDPNGAVTRAAVGYEETARTNMRLDVETSHGEIVQLPDGRTVDGAGKIFSVSMVNGEAQVETPSPPKEIETGADREILVQLHHRQGRAYDASSTIGDISLKNVQGDAEINTTFGKTTVVDHSEGNLWIRTRDGDVSVNGYEREKFHWDGAVDIKTQSGAVQVNDALGRMGIRTGSGNVKAVNARFLGENSQMVTETGDIEVSASNDNLHVVARTAGEIIFPEDFRVTKDEVLRNFSERGRGPAFREVAGTFGEPHAHGDLLSLQSDFGNIIFSRTPEQDKE